MPLKRNMRGARVQGHAEAATPEGTHSTHRAELDDRDELLQLSKNGGGASISVGFTMGDNAGYGQQKFEGHCSVTIPFDPTSVNYMAAERLATRLAMTHLEEMLAEVEQKVRQRYPVGR